MRFDGVRSNPGKPMRHGDPTTPTPAAVPLRDTGKTVRVDPIRNEFEVTHTWIVQATSTELIAASRRLTLTGRAPILGKPLVQTSTPPELQNRGGAISATGFRPFGFPEIVGSRVDVQPTPHGFVARVTGLVGNGSSEVVIGPTTDRNGKPWTTVTERGRYSLTPRVGGLLAPATLAANAMLAFTPVGRAALALSHKLMGELHNYVFDAGGALAQAVASGR